MSKKHEVYEKIRKCIRESIVDGINMACIREAIDDIQVDYKDWATKYRG